MRLGQNSNFPFGWDLTLPVRLRYTVLLLARKVSLAFLVSQERHFRKQIES